MTFMKVTLSRRVGTPSEQICSSCWLIRIFRCNCGNERVVRYLPDLSFPLMSNPFLVGRSFMTRSCTQIQIPSNLNGSSTRMEAPVMIHCWRQRSDQGSGSALVDTWSIPRYLSSLLLYSRFSIFGETALIT